jgi:hypothetical protein
MRPELAVGRKGGERWEGVMNVVLKPAATYVYCIIYSRQKLCVWYNQIISWVDFPYNAAICAVLSTAP